MNNGIMHRVCAQITCCSDKLERDHTSAAELDRYLPAILVHPSSKRRTSCLTGSVRQRNGPHFLLRAHLPLEQPFASFRLKKITVGSAACWRADLLFTSKAACPRVECGPNSVMPPGWDTVYNWPQRLCVSTNGSVWICKWLVCLAQCSVEQPCQPSSLWCHQLIEQKRQNHIEVSVRLRWRADDY